MDTGYTSMGAQLAYLSKDSKEGTFEARRMEATMANGGVEEKWFLERGELEKGKCT